MKITILTQYYPPETGAPQNRLHSLALHLLAAGHQVEILTAMPNYPKMEVFEEYRGRLFSSEIVDGIKVRRAWIFVTKSKGVLPRLINYFSFVCSSLFIGIPSQRADYLICESPPLFLGISAFIISRLKGARMIFNVSDLWPESAEKLGIVGNRMLLKMAYALEAFLYKSSFLVSGQTQGIVKDIKHRFPNVRTHWLPNGVDEEVYAKVQPGTLLASQGFQGKLLFLYAGIVGHAQGLEVIIKAAAQLRDRSDIQFIIIGDGPVKSELQALNAQLGAGVHFIPNTPKADVIKMTAEACAYIVPLKKLDLFKGAIPSKIFDPLPLGVPILLGVEGEAKELFIDQGGAGLAFEPENSSDLAAKVLRIARDKNMRDSMGAKGRDYVLKFFNRKQIAADFLSELSR